ncbi:MAG: hypothetical protein JW940_25120 [Polyangiaceae bacterium]|nr:hypothetical protein [Polyangiaceae bacterium]
MIRASERRRLARTLGAALALAASAGCTDKRPPATPREALVSYAAALEEGRIEDAYALLSEDAKRELTFDAFRRMVLENPEGMRDIAEQLTRPSGPPQVTATVTTPGGQTLLLVYENGQWRVDASAIDLYSQADPKRAISSFIRAFDHRRYDILLRFVPDDERQGLGEAQLREAWEGEQQQQMQQTVRALEAALPTAEVEQLGERATMAFGAAGTVQLVREHGEWKIEDIVR